MNYGSKENIDVRLNQSFQMTKSRMVNNWLQHSIYSIGVSEVCQAHHSRARFLSVDREAFTKSLRSIYSTLGAMKNTRHKWPTNKQALGFLVCREISSGGWARVDEFRIFEHSYPEFAGFFPYWCFVQYKFDAARMMHLNVFFCGVLIVTKNIGR